MKTKSVNIIIFIISTLVFFLQVVGYFAPAWFVKEVVYSHDLKGIFADGRRFKLPYFPNCQNSMDIPTLAEPSDDVIKDEMMKISDSNDPARDDALRRKRAIVKPVVTNENINPEDCDESGNSNCLNNKEIINTLISHDESGVHTMEDVRNSQILTPSKTPVPPSDVFATGIVSDKKKQMPSNKNKSLIYITAGLWYSKACLTTRQSDSDADGNNDIQWCTLYTRYDDNTLEKRMNIFELRIEATLGIVFSAMCLFISSTTCCSQRHHGRRALLSLTTLFISGAITAVPVVHIVMQHVQIYEKIVRPRKWMQLTKLVYRQHDLFDHYSVILCGVASLLSVLSAVVITIVTCRSNSKPDNWYNMSRVQEEKESKHELPINWVNNSKITVPPVTVIKDETKDESEESGYSEVRDDAREDATSSIHDGGSVGNDCDTLEFDPKEMTTFDM